VKQEVAHALVLKKNPPIRPLAFPGRAIAALGNEPARFIDILPYRCKDPDA